MRKKNGFTIVELLGVLAILGILAGIVIFASSNVTKNAEKKYCVSQESLITMAGKDYYADYRSKLPKEIGAVEKVSLQVLIDGNYIKNGKVTDYNGKNCDYQNSYVAVQKQSDKDYNYYTYLKCEGCESGKTGSNPVVEFSPNSKTTNQPITVTMTVKDDEEVSYYSYVIYKNGATYKTVSKTAYSKQIKILLTENGTYEIVGTGYDNKNNIGISTSGKYVISTAKANCKVSINSNAEIDTWKEVPVTFTMTFASGVTDWEWYEKKDGNNYIKKGNFKPTTKQISMDEEGIYNVKVVAYDKYGNTCVTESGKYYVGEELKKVTLTGSVESGQLTTQDVTLTANVEPEKAPKSEEYQYVFEVQRGNTWETYHEGKENSILVKDEGKLTFRVRVKNSKKEATSNTYVTYIDKNPPTDPVVTGTTNDGKAYSFGTWTNQTVTVLVSDSQDAVSGFSHYLYRIKEGDSAFSSFKRLTNNKLVLSTENEYTVQFRACDKIGHCTPIEDAVSQSVYIDLSKPTCTSSDDVDWTNKDVTIKGQCSDKGKSGCAASEVTTKITVPVGQVFDGEKSPGTVKDKAGNETTCSNVSVKIDKKDPDCTTEIENANDNQYYFSPVKLIGYCDDEDSGCKNSNIRSTIALKNNNLVNNYDSSPGLVYDNANNSTICPSVKFTIDEKSISAPVIELYKWKDNEGVAPSTSNTSNRGTSYTAGTWSNKYIYVKASLSTEDQARFGNDVRFESEMSEIAGIGWNEVEKNIGEVVNITKQGYYQIKFRICTTNIDHCSDYTELYDIKIDTLPPKTPELIGVGSDTWNRHDYPSGSYINSLDMHPLHIGITNNLSDADNQWGDHLTSDIKQVDKNYQFDYTISSNADTSFGGQGTCLVKRDVLTFGEDVPFYYCDTGIDKYNEFWGTNGTISVSYRACDNASNCSQYSVYEFTQIVDTLPRVHLYKTDNNSKPSSTSGLSLYTNSSWTNQNVYVNATSTDNNMTIKYQIEGGSETTGSDYLFTEEGTKKIRFKQCAKANINNCSSWTSYYTIKIDKTAPKLSSRECTTEDGKTYTYNPGTWTNQSVTVKANFTDDLSGVDEDTYQYKSVMYSNSSESTYTGRTYTATAYQNVRASVADKAGNKSNWLANVTLNIDKTTPYAPVLKNFNMENATICAQQSYCIVNGNYVCPTAISKTITSDYSCWIIVSISGRKCPNNNNVECSHANWSLSFPTPGPAAVTKRNIHHYTYDSNANPPQQEKDLGWLDLDYSYTAPTIINDGLLRVDYRGKNSAGTVGPKLSVFVDYIPNACSTHHNYGCAALPTS